MKRSILFSFFLAILTVFLLTGCDTRRDDTTVDDRTVITDDDNATRDNTDTEIGTDADRDLMLFENNKDYTFDERDTFKSDIDRALDRIDERIDMIEDKTDDATGETKEAYDRRIKELKDKRDNFEKRIDELDDMKDANWNQFKSNVRTAWMDLKNDVNQFASEVGVEYNQYRENEVK